MTDAGSDATDGGADAEEGGDTDAGNPFAHCAEPVPSSCSLEATCTALKCGEPLSPLDSTGCLRAKCKADADCGAGMRCISTTLVAVGCVSPQLYSCSPDGDTCHCTGMVDCLGLVHCVAVADAPPEQDCQLTGNENCSALLDEKDAIERQLNMMGLGPDLAGKLQACLQKVSAAATANGC